MATAAGLVLGVIPLLISAVENYEVTFQPFVTYRHHMREIRKFATRLNTQRAIFHNECQVLLSSVGQNLADILENPQHPARNDAELSSRLESLLGISCEICVSTVNLINDTIGEVSQETKNFKGMLEGKKWRGKGILTAFRQKIKISFGKTRLNDIVEELRQYNEDLSRLSRQIRQLRTLPPQPHQASTSAVISNVQNTQKASTRLYDLLSTGWACEELVDHTATMSLKVGEITQRLSSKVRFKIALTCNQPLSGNDPLWLAIESSPNEQLTEKTVVNSATSLHVTLGKTIAGPSRSVKFDIATTTNSSNTAPSFQGPHGQLDPLIDLCTKGKLCWYFRHVRSQMTKAHCVGYLEKPNTFKHFLYWDHPPRATAEVTSQAPTLKSVLRSAADEGKKHEWTAKLKLARILALAVLRFHSTPWLPESWDSGSVYFPRDASNLHDTVLEEPYLNVNLSAAIANRQVQLKSFRTSVLAANEMLFNLGIILIELGHDAPFENLLGTQETPLVPRLSNDQVTEFIAARRLGESIHEKLNMTYGRLVEKCLACNFGVTTKLQDPELQAAVVNHVVNQLDICLEQYRTFNILAPPL